MTHFRLRHSPNASTLPWWEEALAVDEIRSKACFPNSGLLGQCGNIIEEYSGVISSTTLENTFNLFSDHQNDHAALAAAMSKKIIDDHGGDIRIEHEPQIRTTVIIELPIERYPLIKQYSQNSEVGERFFSLDLAKICLRLVSK